MFALRKKDISKSETSTPEIVKDKIDNSFFKDKIDDSLKCDIDNVIIYCCECDACLDKKVSDAVSKEKCVIPEAQCSLRKVLKFTNVIFDDLSYRSFIHILENVK